MTRFVKVGLIVLIFEGYATAQILDSPPRSVLINIRGASAIFVDRLLKQGAFEKQSAFDFLIKNAQIKTAFEPVPNAVTAVNNATMETGVYPETHGIIGNSFAKVFGGKIENMSGFVSPFESEPIWEKTARKGGKVIRLGTLQINGFGKNDFQVPTLPQVGPLTESQIVNLSPGSCAYHFESTRAKFRCFVGRDPLIFRSFRKDLTFVAVGEYLIVDEDSNEANGILAKIKKDEWFALELATQDPVIVAGLHAKLLKLDKEVKIYFGPAYRSNGFPRSFVESVEKNIGFTIGGPDYAGFLQGKIDLETLLEQAHRETEFMQKVALFCIRNIEFDLLLFDHPILDRFGHYTGGTDLSKMKNGYLATDKNLNEIIGSLDKHTSLAVVSGHGFTNAHTSFSLRKIIDGLGGRYSDVTAVGSKLSAHIYLNKRDLSAAKKQTILRSLKEKLLSYKDEKTGETIIDKALLPEEMKRIRLYSQPNSGDLWICLKPGYTFDGSIKPGELTGRPTFTGEHGYFDKSPEAKGLLYFYSPKKLNFSGKNKSSTDIAALIHGLVEIGALRPS